jgi:hypothetical protein
MLAWLARHGQETTDSHARIIDQPMPFLLHWTGAVGLPEAPAKPLLEPSDSAAES